MLYDGPFTSDSTALHNLAASHIKYDKGVIKLVTGREYPPQVLNACDYLCDEYDYTIQWIEGI